MPIQYEPLSVSADWSVASIQAALEQLGDEAKHVSSDVFVDQWVTDAEIKELDDALRAEGSLANRVRRSGWLERHEWYVECCGKRVGSKI